jgi:hypothetical protein
MRTATDGPPRCSECTRPARPHYAVGFYRQCVVCARRAQRNYARQKARGRRYWRVCCGCGRPADGQGWCSTACGTAYKRQLYARNKAAVLAALGGRCTCTAADCWHGGRCGVSMPEVLTVEHEHGGGGSVRNRRPTGGLRRGRGGSTAWARYRRALTMADHGMRLLCFNCHMRLTFTQRRAHLPS